MSMKILIHEMAISAWHAGGIIFTNDLSKDQTWRLSDEAFNLNTILCSIYVDAWLVRFQRMVLT